MQPIDVGSLPGLLVFKRPKFGDEFVIGADPAEGNPTSDDSTAHVLNKKTGEEAAVMSGKIEPTIFSSYLSTLSTMYNDAKIMVERNNHGHVVISCLAPHLLMPGMDDKLGWHTNAKSKAEMYSNAADVIAGGSTTIHSSKTMEQLLSIEGGTLKAPEGLMDDCATSFCLGLLGVSYVKETSFAMDYTKQMFTPKKDRRQKLVEAYALQ